MTFSYDRQIKAVDDISFTVEKGEVFGFLGPSGAGKSTTIKLLTRLIVPQANSVFILGRDMAKVDYKFMRKIGISFENDVLYPTLTGYENLYFHAKLYGINKQEIEDVMKTLDIFDARDKPAAQYSKGMKTRLVLARALVTRPEILFLDEPTGGMDPDIAAYVRKVLKDLNNQGTTMFVTTHDMHEAEQLCDRIAFFNSGKIVDIDTPESYKKRYGESRISFTVGDKIIAVDRKNKEELLRLIDQDQWNSIHSQEATLEDIFIKVVGRGLKDGE
ncbi:ABC-2 type transport system ATP-binding protein [Desulfotomaculum arcticum]|uniref:ABC-2 type transport system ATP-binding protein n=1 Tax=Desulfotruncus arcticus DSM 17038 TaxID=1121424 RepID=A0A1I2P7L6_9FIRM|nr:ABC transporter ATP-binding protein [Desulfotruncus arcticus]SFG11503.1 ABC-2 type transport system ATP-binding protein [Desulfotomaculum arcticum] [Desulfotruncus arcticus DSM 17038]